MKKKIKHIRQCQDMSPGRRGCAGTRVPAAEGVPGHESRQQGGCQGMSPGSRGGARTRVPAAEGVPGHESRQQRGY